MAPLLTFCDSYFASGTGAAGLVGAFIWWEVRSLGVRVGVGISSVSHAKTIGPGRRSFSVFHIGVTFHHPSGILLPSSEKHFIPVLASFTFRDS